LNIKLTNYMEFLPINISVKLGLVHKKGQPSVTKIGLLQKFIKITV
jgi:hypothetical protein